MPDLFEKIERRLPGIRLYVESVSIRQAEIDASLELVEVARKLLDRAP